MANAGKKALGRGLGALINRSNTDNGNMPSGDMLQRGLTQPEMPTALSDGSVLLELDPRLLEQNPGQPRQVFNEESLEELAASIKQDGIQEPVLVRRVNDRYEIISGERRVRASIMVDLERIPVICREVSDRDMLKLGLIENIQREDLNAIETARAYRLLMDEFAWTQEDLADQVGKKRATVANSLRLLNLPNLVQDYVADGSLSMGHARALLGIDKVETQLAIARKIRESELSVRQTEKLIAELKKPASSSKPAASRDPNILAIEDRLRRTLGTKVALRAQPQGGGKIEIQYFDNNELERLLNLLHGPDTY